ncbi:MAG: 3D domain-containing protein [Turicibacter sp.]|nr:3D domain-containing protein [Turicibacter sp.]
MRKFGLLALVAMVALVFGSLSAYAANAARSNTVRVFENNRTAVHQTYARTLGEFLEEIGLEIGPNDYISHRHPSVRIENHLALTVIRGFYVDVVIDGELEQVNVPPEATVEILLEILQAEIDVEVLFEGDLDKVLDEDSLIEVFTRRTEFETTNAEIPYQTERVYSYALYVGEEEITQEGTRGELWRKYEIIFIGDEEESRERIDELFTEPIPRIIQIGTREPFVEPEPEPEPEAIVFELGALTDTSSPSFRYVRRVVMEATAYTARPGARTASGRPVEHGLVAVDPNVIPLGTLLYVENYGFALAADTGGVIRGYKIDLFMYTRSEALRFGRRNVVVFILE